MPNFTESDWTAFKIKFMSVIQWVIYAFNDIFDSVRSHPMLYVFVFFPIFAGVVFVIISFLMNLPHSESGPVISDPRKPGTMQPLRYSAASKSLRQAHAQHQGVNLAKLQSTRGGGLNSVKAATTKAAAVSSHAKEAYSKPAMNLASVANRAGASVGNAAARAVSTNAVGNTPGTANVHNFKNTKSFIDSVKGRIDQKRADDKAAQEAYEKVCEEQAALANQHKLEEERKQAEIDRKYFTKVDVYHGKDDLGNDVTRRVSTNTRTGEVSSSGDSINHTNDGFFHYDDE